VGGCESALPDYRYQPEGAGWWLRADGQYPERGMGFDDDDDYM
jgi:hypothetical protein